MSSASGHDHLEEAAARVERRWAAISVFVIALLILMAAFAGIHVFLMPQPRVEMVNPGTLHLAGEFLESNLGSQIEPDGSVMVRAPSGSNTPSPRPASSFPLKHL